MTPCTTFRAAAAARTGFFEVQEQAGLAGTVRK